MINLTTKIKFTLIVLLMLLAIISTAFSQNRWSLLIGINEYEDPKIPDLHGCLNDIESIRSVLVDKYGFDEVDMKIISNEQATRQGILDGFDWLASVTKPNDPSQVSNLCYIHKLATCATFTS